MSATASRPRRRRAPDVVGGGPAGRGEQVVPADHVLLGRAAALDRDQDDVAQLGEPGDGAVAEVVRVLLGRGPAQVRARVAAEEAVGHEQHPRVRAADHVDAPPAPRSA